MFPDWLRILSGTVPESVESVSRFAQEESVQCRLVLRAWRELRVGAVADLLMLIPCRRVHDGDTG